MELSEVHSFLDSINIPRYTAHGSTIGARLRHIKDEKINFESTKQEQE